MDVTKMQPFVDATCEVFETMFKCLPRRGKIRLPVPADRNDDWTAVIGLSGTIRGSVSLMVPPLTSQMMARRMLMAENHVLDAEVVDAIGELANMIAGCAKAKLEGHDVSISLPTVIRGENYWLGHPMDSVTLVVPFNSGIGAFKVNVTFGRTLS
jgi:chemotaxis protein CheX